LNNLKSEQMDETQIQILKKLGININNTTIDIVCDLVNVADYLYDQLEQTEIERFRAELKRIKNPTN
jgi:protein-tyrosine-phosphatase